MKRYINRQITGTIHKGLVKILGEKGANLAWGGPSGGTYHTALCAGLPLAGPKPRP